MPQGRKRSNLFVLVRTTATVLYSTSAPSVSIPWRIRETL